MTNFSTKRGQGRGIGFLRAHVNHAGEDCLIWPMHRDDHGYGLCGFEGRTYKASNLMCRLVHGEPPSPNYVAAHSCGKGHKGCVHPKHISWKTPAENSREAVKHGRYGYNSGGQTGKLKREAVSQIKALAPFTTNWELGLMFGVHRETIAKIRRGETWRDVA